MNRYFFHLGRHYNYGMGIGHSQLFEVARSYFVFDGSVLPTSLTLQN